MSCKSISIIGFGNQAQAWAANLQDSEVQVTIGLRKDSKNKKNVLEKKYALLDLDNVELYHSPCALLIPDHEHVLFFQNHKNNIPKNATFIYAHGHSIQKNNLNQLYPEFNHLLFAPKAIAVELRNRYLIKEAIGGVYSVEFISGELKDKNREWIFSLAKKLGLTLGPYEVSFKEETIADLFSEQSFLCSLIPYASLQSYNLLREEGVSKELAYLEVWMEVDLIVKTLIKVGPQKFFELISPNALVGGEKGKNKLMGDDFQKNMKSLLTDIVSSDFDQEVDKTDVEQLREKISKRWEREEFTQTIKHIQGLA